MLEMVRMRFRIGHYFPYEIKTNIPNFQNNNNVNVEKVRYVCFDFLWKVNLDLFIAIFSMN